MGKNRQLTPDPSLAFCFVCSSGASCLPSSLHQIHFKWASQLRPKAKSLVISLDTEKAFGRTEWPYLKGVLSKFNLGNNFIKWISLLYSTPRTSVITNGSKFLFSRWVAAPDKVVQ